MSDGRSDGWMVGQSVTYFFLTLKMSRFLHRNNQGSPTLILLNVLGVLGALHVINVLNVPMDASLACWALLYMFLLQKE